MNSQRHSPRHFATSVRISIVFTFFRILTSGSMFAASPPIEVMDRPVEMRLAAESKFANTSANIRFALHNDGKVSLGIYDRTSGQLIRTLLRGESLSAGENIVRWDGLDNLGNEVPSGQYAWRLVSSPGFTARYITTIGINPPGGENAIPNKSWVGDHVGAGIVDVDDSGVYVGSSLTEGMMMLLKVNAAMSHVEWTRPQFYEGGQLRCAATSGKHVYMLHPNGKIRRLNKDTGNVEAQWQMGRNGAVPNDLDARGDNLVIVYPSENTVCWLSPDSGNVVASVSLEKATCVAAVGSRTASEALVAVSHEVYAVRPNARPRKVAVLDGDISAMDYDATRKELWVVVDGHKVVRLDSTYSVSQLYGESPRELGPFDPTRFAGVSDIAADLKGGIFLGEPGQAPRRISHIARDGSLINQWFGGMSFYVNGTFDPDDPCVLYGIAPEGSVNVYRIDYATGRWTIDACYTTQRLGDGLFPYAAAFRAIRRHGQLYLYHRVVPAVLRLDPKKRKAIPVAIAGRVLSSGRTFFQFAGTGRDGYPKPWVAAAEHHGYTDLSKAPTLFSWADSDGDGDYDPSEFRFYTDAQRGISFHNPGDFASNGDYLGSAGVNESHAIVRLPVVAWEGPTHAAPRWDWGKAETAGAVIADNHGYGSPRGLSVGPDDSLTVAYQAGLMIRDHGQYEGGGWPELAVRGCRVLGFNARLQPVFAVGRQSKDGAAANTGVLFYPMQTSFGPNNSVIVNDQTKQPAQVWTRDGLYVGGFFDHRAEDGLPEGFYQVHGDDNQGATVVTTKSGKTYWLMPYIGHNRLYEIAGWDKWRRQSGSVSRPSLVKRPSKRGTGLTARHFRATSLIHEAIEAPGYGGQVDTSPIQGETTPYDRIVWSGIVQPPLSDRYQFQSLLGKDEQVAVWIDGRIIHASGTTTSLDKKVDLIAGHPHQIRIEYVNPNGPSELKLLWTSRVLDPTRLSKEFLYPRPN